MMRFGMVIVLSVAMVLVGTVVTQSVVAQDFPYSVPKAPEFDNRGNHLDTGSTQPLDSRHRRHSRRYQQQNSNSLRYGSVKPYVPKMLLQLPRANGRRGLTSITSSRVLQQWHPEPAYQPPPPPQVQQRPDCSRYPMMIARARTEPEMQMTARLYLTCLLDSGWGMDQARQQVINTIESTYRLTR